MQIFMLAVCINLSYMSGIVNVYIYSFKKLIYYKYDCCIAVIIGNNYTTDVCICSKGKRANSIFLYFNLNLFKKFQYL